MNFCRQRLSAFDWILERIPLCLPSSIFVNDAFRHFLRFFIVLPPLLLSVSRRNDRRNQRSYASSNEWLSFDYGFDRWRFDWLFSCDARFDASIPPVSWQTHVLLSDVMSKSNFQWHSCSPVAISLVAEAWSVSSPAFCCAMTDKVNFQARIS